MCDVRDVRVCVQFESPTTFLEAPHFFFLVHLIWVDDLEEEILPLLVPIEKKRAVLMLYIHMRLLLRSEAS